MGNNGAVSKETSCTLLSHQNNAGGEESKSQRAEWLAQGQLSFQRLKQGLCALRKLGEQIREHTKGFLKVALLFKRKQQQKDKTVKPLSKHFYIIKLIFDVFHKSSENKNVRDSELDSFLLYIDFVFKLKCTSLRFSYFLLFEEKWHFVVW